MKVSFTGIMNPHIYVSKEKVVPTTVQLSDNTSRILPIRYQSTMFTCDLTNDEKGQDLDIFQSKMKNINSEYYINKDNPEKIKLITEFAHILNTNIRFCNFYLNNKPIMVNRPEDMTTLTLLSKYTRNFLKDKNLSANQIGHICTTNIAIDNTATEYINNYI